LYFSASFARWNQALREEGDAELSDDPTLCQSAKSVKLYNKHGQFFIRTHNEAFSVAAMRVSNEDRSPVGIHT